MDAIEGLQQQDLAAWRARIRQLRQKLREARSLPRQPQSVPQEAAPPPTPEQPQKPVRSAQRHGRSLEAELKAILTQAAETEVSDARAKEEAWERIDRTRAKTLSQNR